MPEEVIEIVSEKKKDTVLQDALKELEKKYGAGTVLINKGELPKTAATSTGSYNLDRAIGVGGHPEGRVIEIYGPESSGKTTLALHAVKEAQLKYPERETAYVDTEHTLDLGYARDIGVDVDRMMISQPGYGEEALDIVDTLIRTGKFSMIVIDSVANLVPKSELERGMGESSIGVQARLMSQAMRKLVGIAEMNNTTLIFLNQLREKIGVMFGSPEVTTGGNALKFYASVRIDIRRVKPAKPEDEIGNTVRVTIVKNKVHRPFNKCEFEIIWGLGIDKMAEVISLGVEFDIIKKSGSWYSYGDTKIGQGVDSVKQLFKDNEELYNEIQELVNKKLNGL